MPIEQSYGSVSTSCSLLPDILSAQARACSAAVGRKLGQRQSQIASGCASATVPGGSVALAVGEALVAATVSVADAGAAAAAATSAQYVPAGGVGGAYSGSVGAYAYAAGYGEAVVALMGTAHGVAEQMDDGHGHLEKGYAAEFADENEPEAGSLEAASTWSPGAGVAERRLADAAAAAAGAADSSEFELQLPPSS